MNSRNISLLFFVSLLSISWSQHAFAESRAVNIANITGSMFGKAKYCGQPSSDLGDFASESARAIKKYSIDKNDESNAVKQFFLSVTISENSGPIGESCSQFLSGYRRALSDLKKN
jgi:hypothetical protein